jgi:hypothetical protein
MAGMLAVHPDTDVDWGATASTGAFVFRSGRGWFLGQEEGVLGQTLAGTVILRKREMDLLSNRPVADLDHTLRHETVHVLQTDFAFHAVGSSLEGWLLDRNSFTRRVHEFLDFNLLIPLAMTLANRGFGIDYADRPQEAEAIFLAGR